MNLKYSEGYQKTVDSKYLVRSILAPYCVYTTQMVVMDAKLSTGWLIFGPKILRLSKNLKKSSELLTKILRAVPERSTDELER